MHRPLPQVHLSLVFLEGTCERHMSSLRRGLGNVSLQINHLDSKLHLAPSFCHPNIKVALPFFLSLEFWTLDLLRPCSLCLLQCVELV